jgi:signal transduction histidine kinase
LARWTLKPVALSWEQQKQFVADASHELKTPLTVILANTGILLSHKQDTIEAQSKWIEYTQTEANRMKKLIDDLLFLAKADAAHKSLIQSTVNLSDVLWHCILPFESVAYENGVRIDTNIEPDLCFMGNEGQLQQLVVILIDNACKYAGRSGLVTVNLVRKYDELILKINNTGAIIPTDHLNHIFDRFYRVDTARTRERGGYGLGLAIAHTIVDTHKGNIRVTSNEIDGTTFEVRFK